MLPVVVLRMRISCSLYVTHLFADLRSSVTFRRGLELGLTARTADVIVYVLILDSGMSMIAAHTLAAHGIA